jgi:hypothetical protein
LADLLGRYLDDRRRNAFFRRDLGLTTYGWVWFFVAILLFGSGLAVMVRSQFARWIGIIAAAIGAISAIWWIPYYPVWSFVYILIAMLVIYGLAAYGQREPAR